MAVVKKILVVILIGLLGGSVYFNIQAHQEIQSKETTILKQKKATKKNLQSLATVKEELIQTQSKVEEKEVAINNGDPYAEVNKSYQDVTKNVFDILYNFTPENFKDRQAEAKKYLSSDVYDSFFNTNSQYGDSNTVTSELLDLTIYNQSVQGTTLNGLVVLVFQSNVEGAEPIKNRAIYQVSYDTNENVLTAMNMVTTGLSGDLLE
ncbi:hypothetical protein [Enterococcus sp. AZ103]|uniref:hypothetical protein n=1 Tax=Enterococcus sp. AZ103 TaxID=2774628 RepID=UPI003F27C99C